MTRYATVTLLQMVEDGILSADAVMRACLNYMSEDHVNDMALSEGFLDDDDEELEEPECDDEPEDEDCDFDGDEDDKIADDEYYPEPPDNDFLDD